MGFTNRFVFNNIDVGVNKSMKQDACFVMKNGVVVR